MRLETICRVKKIYEENKNITKYLQELNHRDYNTTEDIMMSYDFQSGTYNARYFRNPKLYEAFHAEISENLEHYIQKIRMGG